MTVQIGLSWLPHGTGLDVPRQMSAGAAGMDILAALGPDETIVLVPGQRALVPAGFAMALPIGFEAQVRPRSGLAAKFGVTVLNAPGTIDADYRGEVKVILINHGEADFAIRRGDRIAQMVVAPVLTAAFEIRESLDETERGTGGFGSTGHRA
jgi:dUTP pyrophosphatase